MQLINAMIKSKSNRNVKGEREGEREITNSKLMKINCYEFEWTLTSKHSHNTAVE